MSPVLQQADARFLQPTAIAALLLPDKIFAKTVKGQEEITLRTHALSSKQRRVLIMANGTKDLASIATFIPPFELQEVVPFLLKHGFIKASKGDTTAVDTTAVSRTQEAAGTSSHLTQNGSREQDAGKVSAFFADETGSPNEGLDGIKQFMTEAVSSHLGLLGTELIERIQSAQSSAALQAVVGYWHLAVLESKTGAHNAPLYLQQVKKALTTLESKAGVFSAHSFKDNAGAVRQITQPNKLSAA